MEIRIKRNYETNESTIGQLFINEVLYFYTLELKWRDNKKSISCIPVGEYTISKRFTDKRGSHLIVNNTAPRQFILLHAGTTHKDIQGCILVGDTVSNIINQEPQIFNTRNSIGKLNALVFKAIEEKEVIKLIITNGK